MRYGFMSLVLVGLVASVASAQEPKKKDNNKQEVKEITEWAGKDFKQWKKELHNFDPAEREVAFRVIIKFPLAKVYTALPEMLAELKKHSANNPVDYSVRVNGIIAIGLVLQAKQQPDADLMEYLKEHSTPDKKPDPEVVKKMMAKSMPDPKHLADALAIIKTAIKDQQIILKVRAAQILPYLGPEARKLLPEIKELCKDPSSWEVRKEALMCLTVLCSGEKTEALLAILPEFSRRLDPDTEKTAQVRMTAAVALGGIGSALEDKDKPFVLKKLEKAAEADKDLRVRITAHVAMMTTSHKPSTVHLGAIMKYQGDGDQRVRLAVVQGLASAGPAGKKIMPGMVSNLLLLVEDENLEVGTAALAALLQIGAVETAPNLQRIKQSYEKSNKVLFTAIEDTVEQMDFMIKHEKDQKNKKDKGDKK